MSEHANEYDTSHLYSGSRHEAWMRETAAERREVLARYGTAEAVLAPCREEMLLHAATKKWAEYYENSTQVKSIDGFDFPSGELPKRVIKAFAEAYPLPKTITEAYAEECFWEKLDRDRELILEDSLGNFHLELPAQLRRHVLEGLLRRGLRAQSLTEVAMRVCFVAKIDAADLRDCDDTADFDALLADLEHLNGQQCQP